MWPKNEIRSRDHSFRREIRMYFRPEETEVDQKKLSQVLEKFDPIHISPESLEPKLTFLENGSKEGFRGSRGAHFLYTLEWIKNGPLKDLNWTKPCASLDRWFRFW